MHATLAQMSIAMHSMTRNFPVVTSNEIDFGGSRQIVEASQIVPNFLVAKSQQLITSYRNLDPLIYLVMTLMRRVAADPTIAPAAMRTSGLAIILGVPS